MSTYLAYERYYNDLNETHPELTTDEERRAQLSRYVAGEFKPRLSEKKILEMLEKNSLTYPPHPLPRYSSAEGALRAGAGSHIRLCGLYRAARRKCSCAPPVWEPVGNGKH